jgi:hypothetical protein
LSTTTQPASAARGAYCEVLDGQLAVAERHVHTNGALACERVNVTDGEFALRQNFEHGFTDDTRGADDGYIKSICHCPVYVMAGVPD